MSGNPFGIFSCKRIDWQPMAQAVYFIRKLFQLFISFIFYYSGIIAICRKLCPRKGILILAYHRINDDKNGNLNLSISPTDFETQLDYLRRFYRIITLAEAIQLLKANQKPPSNTVVVTFDDGYRDNYTNAFPVLKKYQIPATIFLAVNHILNNQPLWYDSIEAIILNSSEKTIDLKNFGMGTMEIMSARQKKDAINQIVQYVKKNMSGYQRDELVAALKQSCGKRNPVIDSANLMLTWDQINEMNQHQIDFGAHTLTHPILTQLSQADAQREISLSKKLLEEALGKQVDFFAYPNGLAGDYNDSIFALVKDAGFLAACTLMPGINHNNSNLFSLYRLGIDRDYTGGTRALTRAIFAAEIAGIFDFLLIRFLRK